MTAQPGALHPELLGLLEAVRGADEEDMAPYLILIDWLEEHGNEQERERAQLLRLHCEAAALEEGSPERDQILTRMRQFHRAHRKAWFGCLAGVAVRCEVDRGLAELTFTGQRLTEHPALASPEAKLVLPWVRGIVLVNIQDASPDLLARAPLPPELVSLQLSTNHAKSFGHRRLIALLNLPQLGQLRELNLAFCRLGAVGMAALADSPRLRRLRSLDLTFNRITPEILQGLMASPHLGDLTDLTLDRNLLGDQAAPCLAGCERLRSLRRLSLRNCLFQSEGVAALAGTSWPNLKTLELGDNALWDEGVSELVRAPLLGRLTSLDLRANLITDDGARALASGPPLPLLSRLNLESNRIGVAGARALLESESLQNVRRFRLGGNEMRTHEGQALEAQYGARISTEMDIPF